MANGAVLAGRVRELETVTAMLAGASERVALVVSGEPGVGKSRLLAVATDCVTRADVLVLPGWCLALSGGLPLSPVIDVLRGLVAVDGGRCAKDALAQCPRFVRGEVARLVPELGDGEEPAAGAAVAVGGVGGDWQRQRLFEAVRRLLSELAKLRRVAIVVEDLHWADATTLAFLEVVLAPGGLPGVPLAVTCRSDEPMPADVVGWLDRARRNPRVRWLELAPLNKAETAEQIAQLVGHAPCPELVRRIFARSEGNAFFTEQLVSATADNTADQETAGDLPAGLTGLLLERTAALTGTTVEVLTGLAVAGVGLDEQDLATLCAKQTGEIRAAVRELAARRLLRRPDSAGCYQLRHALLAEAVTGELLPGERTDCHVRVAELLADRDDPALAGRIAEHYAAAGDLGDELRWRIAAARRAESLFAWQEAADQWLRVLELWKRAPDEMTVDGMTLLEVHGAAQDALDADGRELPSRDLARDGLARYASGDTPSRAEALRRAGWTLAREGDERGVDLLRQAIDLYERLPPSAGFVHALDQLASALSFRGHARESDAILQRAADVASQTGDRSDRLRILGRLTSTTVNEASVDQIASLRAELTEADPPGLHATCAVVHTFILAVLGRHAENRRIGLPAIAHAQRHGVVATSGMCANLYQNVAESLLELGDVRETAALIDPPTNSPLGPDPGTALILHAIRAHLDMLRGAAAEASRRWADIRAAPEPSLAFDVNMMPWQVEHDIWRGDYWTALDRARSRLERIASAEGGTARNQFLHFACALLVLGQRAVADLADQARAQQDGRAVAASRDATSELEALRHRFQPRPFGPGDRRPEALAELWQWRAELSRARTNSNVALWEQAAEKWEELNRPHRAGYARWRQTEALLAEPGHRRAAAEFLRDAARLAHGHVPLTNAITDLAHRARIDLTPPAAPDHPGATEPPKPLNPLGLTDRELAVLRLVADGRSNAEIGARLFISTKTASVHVTHILRKLDVATRVQAAAVAARAGLLTDPAGTAPRH